MGVAADLAGAAGKYFGRGDGDESGPFAARIEVAVLPNGSVSIDYEATSPEHGVQHREHAVLCVGPDGCDRLYIAHAESPFVTEMVEDTPGSGRFVQPQPFGPYAMSVVIVIPAPCRIIYAWLWAAAGEEPTEQSRADVTLV